jgi:predicted nucleotidyltransferase
MIPKMGTPRQTKTQQRSRRALPGSRRKAPQANLIGALFSSTQRRVLGLLFGQPNRSFFTRELIALAQAGSGAVQRELARLRNVGLVTMTQVGNQRHFQANHDAPIFDELRMIMLKTVGLAEPVKSALGPLTERIERAFLYGSIAKQTDTASSDVDLLIVSPDLSLEETYTALQPVEKMICRKISVTLLTPKEYARRLSDNSPFLSKTLASDHLVLFGETNGLAATG